MHWRLRHAVRCIRNGGVIAYPTETVYGLGCDPFNAEAVARLLALKQRDWQKGLILIASHLDQVGAFIRVDDMEDLSRTITNESDVVSWLLPATQNLPLWISGQHDSVAIRISKHPQIIALCDSLQQAIVSTSANPSARKPATNALQVRRYFQTQLDYVLHSSHPCNNRPSKLVRYPSRVRLR